MVWSLFTSIALADQCAWIDAAIAERAVRWLAPGTVVATQCEPCGERTAAWRVVGESSMRPTGSGSWEVAIDGAPIDLAYVFVAEDARATTATNLAHLARCPATGVSRELPRPLGAVALDLPVPSPCAQRTDSDGDGRWDFVQEYRYGADRALRVVSTDTDADGHPEAIVTFTLDARGQPVRGAHDDPADGHVDRTSDCATTHCTTNWVPQCPASADCTTGPQGLFTEMRRGRSLTVNDYACWKKVDGFWRYEGPR
jgi:hypothetical protein